ncbi:hypothetical protein HPB50_016225 [Hyalomma asiaticum]|uniref:Uncharacterized protein n=1 Tax=Hyalomma asiaticum TaxID=266040 RepID=A0ACB7RPF0_HYAAI|nr:hypothetical protein HPB50_016225 [Hyalomma asiaticum]
MKDIKEPAPPTGITMVSLSHAETLLRWQAPAKLFGTLTGYSVQICDAFTHCDAHEDGHHCTEHNTTKPILKFESTADTAYCVFVFAIVRCGTDITSSSPAKKKIRTPLLAIPEVENLHLVSVLDKAVTLEWEKPRASFDYYRVDTTFAKDYHDKARIPKRVGSCDNGMIVPPDRNGVTCGYLEACTNVTFKVRTYRKGPPKLLSSGVILRDIFIPGQGLDSPTDINVESKTIASTVLRWKPPAKVQGILGEYKVKICNSYEACGLAEKMCDCTEYRTLPASIEVNETSVAYCVLVTATSQCGADILESRPFAKEVRMHSPDEVRTSSSQWVKWHGNTVPENALPGGQDSNHTMYICRATHKDQLTPGKYAPMNSVCYVSYAGSEHAYEKFEVTSIPERLYLVRQNFALEVGVGCHSMEKTGYHRKHAHMYKFRYQKNSGDEELTAYDGILKMVATGNDTERNAARYAFCKEASLLPPNTITRLYSSSSRTQISWTRAIATWTNEIVYHVEVCVVAESCDAGSSFDHCATHSVRDPWLDINSTLDTTYCLHQVLPRRWWSS